MVRFGLQQPNFTYEVPDAELFDHVCRFVTAAEDAGVESVWVMDHFYQLPALGGQANPILEAYTLLGALAVRTERVKLGTLVTGVTYRNPAMLAKIVTTLDVISQGRAILGIGAAWHDTEHTGYGFDFPRDGVRLDMLEEAVQICRGMFTEESTTLAGRHFRTQGASNVPRPIQAGGPEIMIGGGGEKRTLKLVARYADYCNVTGDAAMMRHKIKVLRDHCESVGRDPSHVTVTRMSSLFPCETDQQVADTREFLRAAAGEDADRMFDVGTVPQLYDRIAEIAAEGCDYFIFNMPTEPDPSRVGDVLAGFVEHFA